MLNPDHQKRSLALTREICGLKVAHQQLIAAHAAAKKLAGAASLQGATLRQQLQVGQSFINISLPSAGSFGTDGAATCCAIARPALQDVQRIIPFSCTCHHLLLLSACHICLLRSSSRCVCLRIAFECHFGVILLATMCNVITLDTTCDHCAHDQLDFLSIVTLAGSRGTTECTA